MRQSRFNGALEEEADMTTIAVEVGPAQNLATLVGRVLMSLIFIWSGYVKLVDCTGTQAYLAGLGVPLPEIAWIVTVAVELVGGLTLLLGFQARLAGLILAAWSVATALVAHANFADPDMQIHFMKNVAMAGGFLYVAAFGAGAYAVERAFRAQRG
jgi:putative oxidoreductase